MRILTTAGAKGGTGKTTAAVNLAAVWAERGARVALIDLDPQASASRWLGVAGDGALMAALRGEGEFDACISPSPAVESLAVIASTRQLSRAESELAGDVGRLGILRAWLTGQGHRFDRVVIDLPPAIGALASIGFLASQAVLFPVEGSTLALPGLAETLASVERVKALNPELWRVGIVAGQLDHRTRIAREVLDLLRKQFPALLLATTIRRAVRLQEAPGHQEPITTYDPEGGAAQDFRALADEIERREAQR